MAFCGQCGQKVKDGAGFCNNCGASLKQRNDQNTFHVTNNENNANVNNNPYPTYGMNAGNTSEYPEELSDKISKGMEQAKEKAIVGGKIAGEKMKEASGSFIEKCKTDTRVAIGAAVGAAAVVIAIIAVIIFANLNDSLNVSDYIVVEENGYDGYGTIDYYLDEEEFYEGLAKEMGVKLDEDDMAKKHEQIQKMHGYELFNLIDISIEQNNELKNGENVVISIKYDNKKADKYGVTLKGEKLEHKVSSLKELTLIDPFENLEVEFDGTSPYASMRYDYSGDTDVIDTYSFQPEKTDNVAIGDEIEINFVAEDEYLARNGVKVENKSKTYKCETLDYYVSDIAGMESFGGFSDIKSESEDVIESYFAGYSDQLQYDNVSYEGCYLLKNKNEDSWGSKNIVYVIYKCNVSSKVKADYTDKENGIKKGKPLFTNKTVYMPIEFTNVILKKDGTISYNSDQSILGTTDLSSGDWSNVRGYTDTSKMYNDLVSANKVNFVCETGFKGNEGVEE